jgi:hypothetical protein
MPRPQRGGRRTCDQSLAVAVADNAQVYAYGHVNVYVVRVLAQRPWSPTSGPLYLASEITFLLGFFR